MKIRNLVERLSEGPGGITKSLWEKVMSFIEIFRLLHKKEINNNCKLHCINAKPSILKDRKGLITPDSTTKHEKNKKKYVVQQLALTLAKSLVTEKLRKKKKERKITHLISYIHGVSIKNLL